MQKRKECGEINRGEALEMNYFSVIFVVVVHLASKSNLLGMKIYSLHLVRS
jgi:hypothetical protein